MREQVPDQSLEPTVSSQQSLSCFSDHFDIFIHDHDRHLPIVCPNASTCRLRRLPFAHSLSLA
jgi:hypothetical protein